MKQNPNAPSVEREPLIESPPLATWSDVKRRLLQKLGLEEWPTGAFFVYNTPRAPFINDLPPLFSGMKDEFGPSVHGLSLSDFTQYAKGAKAPTGDLTVLRQEIGLLETEFDMSNDASREYVEARRPELIRLEHVLGDTAEREKTMVVFFLPTKSPYDPYDFLPLVHQFPNYGIIYMDAGGNEFPEFTPRSITLENPDTSPRLDAETRARLLDTLSVLLSPFGYPDHQPQLVRALRMELGGDVGLERAFFERRSFSTPPYGQIRQQYETFRAKMQEKYGTEHKPRRLSPPVEEDLQRLRDLPKGILTPAMAIIRRLEGPDTTVPHPFAFGKGYHDPWRYATALLAIHSVFGFKEDSSGKVREYPSPITLVENDWAIKAVAAAISSDESGAREAFLKGHFPADVIEDVTRERVMLIPADSHQWTERHRALLFSALGETGFSDEYAAEQLKGYREHVINPTGRGRR